ncbi:MAG: polysaccharide deacetylase family protein [Myxococcota bacterium]
MRALALTLDLDGPAEYAALHDVSTDNVDPLVMYRAPLDRFVALCKTLGGTGTLFVVGRDARDEAAARLREVAAEGFEIACHSAAHDYRLSRRTPEVIRNDLSRAREQLEMAVGSVPRGFRAPGYHLSPALLDALEACGFAYDSSVMPSPPYYVAKAAVLAAYRLARRSTASLLGSPRLVLAPRGPYRPGDDPYATGNRSIVELPIAVSMRLGLPVTGTSLVMAPVWLQRRMLASLVDQDVVVINLHAMDFSDPEGECLPSALERRQPELRIPVAERDATLRGALAVVGSGRRLMTCAEIAEAWAG